MIDTGRTFIAIRETVPVGADALFAVLADPRRHIEIDGSGMLRPTTGTTVLTATGQVFTMEMTYPSLGGPGS